MKENYSAKIEHIIALCHIIDDFEEFSNNLFLLLSRNMSFKSQLFDISRGDYFLLQLFDVSYVGRKFGARKAKKFYNENRTVIDIINKYSNVYSFIKQNYSNNGKLNSNINFFYKYLVKNKEKIGEIIPLLEKIKKLGFDDFEFNEKLDFTKEKHYISPHFYKNSKIIYVANAEAIPNYEEYVDYKSKDTNYKMELLTDANDISNVAKRITLNSLLFDINTLPVKTDRENTFEYILKLKNNQKEKTNVIRNSVDFSIGVLDLEEQLELTSEIISRIYDKKEAVAILSNLKKDVEKLKKLSEQYDDSIIKEDNLVTKELLEKEKKAYIKRRIMSYVDSC